MVAATIWTKPNENSKNQLFVHVSMNTSQLKIEKKWRKVGKTRGIYSDKRQNEIARATENKQIFVSNSTENELTFLNGYRMRWANVRVDMYVRKMIPGSPCTYRSQMETRKTKFH